MVEVGFLAVFYQTLNWIHPFTVAGYVPQPPVANPITGDIAVSQATYLSWKDLLGLQALQLSLTLLFGCIGLWLGGVIGRSEKAANSARVTALIAFVGSVALQPNLTVPLVVVGGLIFFCLIMPPKSGPRAFQSGVLFVVSLLTGSAIWNWLGPYQPTLQLLHYSPVMAICYDDNLAMASLAYLGLALSFGYLSYRQVLKSV
jgi:hypothetical protein